MSFPAVDTIWLGQDQMPGQWVLQPTQKEYGWQIQQSWGLSGATVRPVGDQLVVANFLVKFWNVADWNYFQQFRTKYLARATYSTSPSFTYAIGITHPELNFLGVTSVVPRKVPVFVNNGKGLWTGMVEFLQYRKPQPVLESPNATIPSAAPPTPAAADALEQAQQTHLSGILGSRGEPDGVGPS